MKLSEIISELQKARTDIRQSGSDPEEHDVKVWNEWNEQEAEVDEVEVVRGGGSKTVYLNFKA